MDIIITLRIDDTKLTDLKIGLAKYFKVDSTEITPAFFKGFLRDMLYKFYKTGKIWLAQETTAPVIDETIIEVV